MNAKGPRSGGAKELDDLAGAVADATPVDWGRLRVETPALERQVRGLRALEQIAAASRAGTRADRARVAPAGERADRTPLFPWGHLQVFEKLGEGSFGEVYRAFDPVLERDVALKLERVSGRGRQRGEVALLAREALEEARRLARVRHPNVLIVHGADVREGRVGIWTDLLSGRTLEERLQSEGALDAPSAALIGLDVCRALDAVHRSGLIHGDVKTTNVIEEEGGRIVLLDFGSGHDFRISGDRTALKGTPVAMAPEVLAGEPQTPADDLYALGVLLYRLSVGRYPVEGGSLEELRQRHRAAADRRLSERHPDLPAPFVDVLERALAPREARFSVAGEMDRALSDALLAIGASANETAVLRRPGAASSPGNLPLPLTRFIGREAELERLPQVVRDERLVTLTGAGGSGKTRLAVEVARSLERSFPAGVWFVDLAPVRESGGVEIALAGVIGFRERPRSPLREELIDHLARRRTLLVLDNCEHLRGAVAALAAELVGRGEGAHVLATSREDLGVTGERIIGVAPMAVPAPDVSAPEELAGIESVRLFVERAAAISSRFELDAETAESVAGICRRVDGIPLALELAAARVRALPIEEIARHLDERLALLERKGGAGPARHQTLEALIEWSYQLLPAAERALFGRLAVFAGGWTLEAAGAVCAGEGVDERDVVGLLANLVGKSLVERDGHARYRMLETVREFAGARGDTRDDPASRHLEQCVALLEELGGDAAGTGFSLFHLGRIARLRGDPIAARKRYTGALRLFERIADPRGKS